jgi:hypothetical protein
VVDGRTVYEINVGYFATEALAQRALALLRPRFPQAAILDLQPPAAVAATPPGGPAPQPAPALLAEVEAQAQVLLAKGQAAYDVGDFPAAIVALDSLLNLPPNPATRRAHLLVGQARLKAGDALGARREFELFVKLFPQGADADQARALLATLPPEVPAVAGAKEPRRVEPITGTDGSVSAFFFGGRSKVRTQEFEDSPVGGVATLLSDATLSSTEIRQVQTSVDLNWRHRDADGDQRLVFRDSFTGDGMPNRPDKNRLSALYYEHRLPDGGTGLRVGRQSPSGYGVLYRFDGAQGSYAFAPRWKVNGVWGTPTDKLLDTHRVFYGLSLEAEALTPALSGDVYAIQQTIDGIVDRRAIGAELRWFQGGASVSGQLDYDTALRGLNIATLQGTWQQPDSTVYNAMFDHRSVPVRMLGNMLFFQDPTLSTPARKMADLVASTPLAVLRQQANGLTPMQTQATAGFTRPLFANWQGGADVRYTHIDPIPAIPAILPNGQPGTGNMWGTGLQLIGSNVFSLHDTHVFAATWLSSPSYKGTLVAYNNLTSFNGTWQLEPALRYYTQSDNAGTTLRRWTSVLRGAYHMQKLFTLEGELTYEMSRSSGAQRTEDANRVYFYFGGRHDF